MTRDYQRWTREEDAQLLFLREHCKKQFAEIERLLGRKLDAARGRYRVLKPAAEPVIVESAGRRTNREMLDDAIRRRALLAAHGPRTLTAAFFGDPPPGRSALDQKRGEARA